MQKNKNSRYSEKVFCSLNRKRNCMLVNSCKVTLEKYNQLKNIAFLNVQVN